MENNLESFKKFMKRREIAAQSYVCGDPTLVTDITAHVTPVSFFDPRGGVHRGTDKVLSKFNQDAAMFDTGSKTNFEILEMAASDNIAYWVGFQRAVAYLKGNSEAFPMNLRVTEIFCREKNEWKLIHRHADLLAPDAVK